MSTPLDVLLKAESRLEGDVADDEADPLVCLPDICLAVFFETAGLMDHQHKLRHIFFI